jgi:multiple sugar transport system permease protein
MQRATAEPVERPAIASGWFTLSDAVWKWILLTPAVAVVVGLLLFPILMTLYVSFTDWHLFAYDRPIAFVGLATWSKVLFDSAYLIPARNTMVFVLASVPATYLIGLIVSLALNEITIGRRFFRIFFLVPIMVSPVTIALVIGRMLFNENNGPINDLLFRAGLPPQKWLTDPTLAMATLVIIEIWHHSSFTILMLTAALQALPRDPYEAATVDGAGPWQSFRYITLPLLIPISVTAILIRSLDAFKVVDIVRVVTGGGPGTATESLTLAVYDLGIKGGDLAQGSAGAYILLILMAAFSAVVIVCTRRWVQQAL